MDSQIQLKRRLAAEEMKLMVDKYWITVTGIWAPRLSQSRSNNKRVNVQIYIFGRN